MYVHDTLQRFQRPNFRQRAIAASQLYGAMRKSRQPRCIAAISINAAEVAGPMPESGFGDSRPLGAIAAPMPLLAPS
jgi:hypothetical protein